MLSDLSETECHFRIECFDTSSEVYLLFVHWLLLSHHASNEVRKYESVRDVTSLHIREVMTIQCIKESRSERLHRIFLYLCSSDTSKHFPFRIRELFESFLVSSPFHGHASTQTLK